MATISNTLSLQDKITPTLTKAQRAALDNIKTFNEMSSSVDAVKKSLEEAEKANPKIVETEMYSQAVEGLQAMENKLYDVGTGQDTFNTKSKGMKMSITDVNQSLEVLNKAMAVFNKLASEANEWIELNTNQLSSEISVATALSANLGLDSNTIKSYYDYASALQEVGIVGDEATLAGAGTLAMYVDSEEQLQRLIPMMDDLAVKLNLYDTSQSDVVSSAESLGKALSGTSALFLKNVGATDKQIEAFNNLTTKEERLNALTQLFAEKGITGMNEALARTAQGGIKQADNALGDMQETLGEKLTPYLYAFKSAVATALAPAVNWITEHMNIIAPIILGVAAVIGILIGMLTILAVVNGIVALSEMAAFWPLALIAAALILIIVIIGLMIKQIIDTVNWINEVTGWSLNATGVIIGALYGLYAVIYNVFYVYSYNVIADFVNFFANCFKNPIASVKILFKDLAVTVLKTVQSMIEGIEKLINLIPGVNINISSGVGSYISKLESDIQAAKEDMEWKDVMQKKETKDVYASVMEGYQKGVDIQNKFESFSDFDATSLLDGTIFDDSTFKNLIGTDSAGGSALKVTSDDDLLSDEDIQLLLDVATRDYKLNYQQITPDITITFGDIRETADVDDILDQVADKLEEIYDGNLEV